MDFLDTMKWAIHNRDVEIKRLSAELARAKRALESSRAMLANERAMGRESAEVLSSLESFCDSGMVPAPGFVAMHCRVAKFKLGR